MGNYSSTLQLGSKGSRVEEIQKALNKAGYNLEEDGIFGKKTSSAVRAFQKENGLDVDGIVGNQTNAAIEKFLKSSSNKGISNDDLLKMNSKFSYKDFSYDDYKESGAVNDALAALNAQIAKKPGEYKSQWQAQLDDTINKILNREKFSYDLNGDALYQQYKDKYIQQGKMAMGDAIGQASAMTGGYGNSYAQSVGQQQYQASLEKLNDIVPELYQMAYDQYNQEGQDLYNQYSMLGAQEEQDYGRHRDSVSDWQSERDYLANRYDSERDYDYSKYNNERDFAYGQYSADRGLAYDKFSDDRAYKYQSERDKIADERWEKEFEMARRQFDESQKKNSVGDNSSPGGTGNEPIDEEKAPPVDPNSKAITNFKSKLYPESSHDAVSRATYGPYTSYVAVQIAQNSSLSDEEKMHLIQLYGITESDLKYARSKGFDI